MASHVDSSGALVRESLSMLSMESLLLIHAGDFDLDGDTDLITGDEQLRFIPNEPFATLGLNILRNGGAGRMDTLARFPDLRFNGGLQVLDLNADGRLDFVVVHNDMRNPAVLVFLGRGEGRFLQEGRYPLREGRGGPTLGGDLDGDGDVDLVVFDESGFESGGVHVLRNRLSEQVTAVAAEEEGLPGRFRLGAAYPNPFNPSVVIPFVLAASSAPAGLTVYNSLGQVVRRLELGVLPAGAGRVVWDGRDGSGREVGSGVYVYRLQVGAWSASGKVVKVE